MPAAPQPPGIPVKMGVSQIGNPPVDPVKEGQVAVTRQGLRAADSFACMHGEVVVGEVGTYRTIAVGQVQARSA